MARRILLVEDDEKSRRLLCDVLTHCGHEVASFETGEAGLRAAQACQPDAALLDIQLPGMDGFEVLKKLRAAFGHSVPVIAVTASVMGEERTRILASGFDAHLAKPVNIRYLIETLDALLGKAPT